MHVRQGRQLQQVPQLVDHDLRPAQDPPDRRLVDDVPDLQVVAQPRLALHAQVYALLHEPPRLLQREVEGGAGVVGRLEQPVDDQPVVQVQARRVLLQAHIGRVRRGDRVRVAGPPAALAPVAGQAHQLLDLRGVGHPVDPGERHDVTRLDAHAPELHAVDRGGGDLQRVGRRLGVPSGLLAHLAQDLARAPAAHGGTAA